MKYAKRLLIILLSLISANVIYADDELGYKGKTGKDSETAKETLERLQKDPDVVIANSDGWTIVTSRSQQTIWSFTPANHPAHLSYVKRKVVERDGSIYIDTSAKCGAEKHICDKLVRDFIELNNRVSEDVSSKKNKGP